jgi:diguanylate cyclase (GGDEF)-like protein
VSQYRNVSDRVTPYGTSPFVRELASWPDPLPQGATGEDLDRVFLRSAERRSLVVMDAEGEPFVVNRSDFYLQYAGPLGFGRALLARRAIDRTAVTPAPIVDGTMPVWLAGVELFGADISTVDDVGVRDEHGRVGTMSFGALLQVLRTQAEDLGEEYRRLAERLKHQALHDGLTGLPNRAAFVADGAELIRASVHTGGGAVVFCDLDGFKAVNDRFGHVVGDAVLIAVAGRFLRVLPPRAIMARVGGDEFGIAIPGDLTLAKAIGAELRRSLATPIEALGVVVGMGVSIGIATTAESNSFSVLLQRADDAMYGAKRNGRGVSTWRRTAHDASTLERVAIELVPALETGQLSMHYQPIIDLNERRAVGAEALLRWQHPELGAISPADFIPVAEAQGLMVPVGQWILERALDGCALWQRAGYPTALHINVSTKQLLERSFAETAVRAAHKRNVDPADVVLEVTETALMTDVGHSIEVLERLRHAGFRIAVDDFGVGYSSLSYLADLPLDMVKLDARFTRNLNRDGRDRSLTAGVVAVAHSLGLTVVAEAVEAESEHQELHELGFDMAQGFLYGRPGVDPTFPGDMPLQHSNDVVHG